MNAKKLKKQVNDSLFLYLMIGSDEIKFTSISEYFVHQQHLKALRFVRCAKERISHCVKKKLRSYPLYMENILYISNKL